MQQRHLTHTLPPIQTVIYCDLSNRLNHLIVYYVFTLYHQTNFQIRTQFKYDLQMDITTETYYFFWKVTNEIKIKTSNHLKNILQ